LSSLLKCCCTPKLGAEASLPLPPATPTGCNPARTLDDYKVTGGPITVRDTQALNCDATHSSISSTTKPWDGLIHRLSIQSEYDSEYDCSWGEGADIGPEEIESWEGRNFPGKVFLGIEDGSYMSEPYWKLRLDDGAIASRSWVGVKGSGDSPIGVYNVICNNGSMEPRFLTIIPA